MLPIAVAKDSIFYIIPLVSTNIKTKFQIHNKKNTGTARRPFQNSIHKNYSQTTHFPDLEVPSCFKTFKDFSTNNSR